MDKLTSVMIANGDEFIYRDGFLLGKIEPHNPIQETYDHAKELNIKPGEFAQLTGRVFAFKGGYDWISFYQLA